MRPLRQFLVLLTVSVSLLTTQTVHSETFEEALISVYNSNPRLMAARFQLREVDENYIQARAQGRLNANISGNLGYATNRSSGAFVPGLPDQSFSREGTPSAAQFQVIQPLYQGGRVRALKDQARAGIMAAREQLRSTEQELLLQGANAYLDVLRDEELARIRRNSVSVLARQELAAQERFEVGVGTRTDIAQAQSRLAASEAGVAAAEAQLQSSRATYMRIVGHLPVELKPVPRFELPATVDAAIALARQNNPNLLAAVYNQSAAKAAIGVAKSAGKPVVSLNGTLGGQRSQINGLPTADQAALTAQITIPLFAGGGNKSRVRQALNADTRMGFEIRDAERSIDERVRQIWAQLEAAQQALKSSRLQIEAAKVAFEGVELEQSVGTRTTLDVLDSEQEVLNAKLSYIDAKRNLDAATFQLLTVLGVFDAQGIHLPVDFYDPKENLDNIKDDGLFRLTRKLKSKKIYTNSENIKK